MHLMETKKTWRKSQMENTQGWYMLFWTNPGNNTPQNSCTSHHKNNPSWTKPAGDCCRSKDELVSDVFLWNPTHGRISVGWLAKTCISSVRTLDVVWRTNWKQRMIGTDGVRESGKSMLDAHTCRATMYVCSLMCVYYNMKRIAKKVREVGRFQYN